jgi:hypothetical protein
MTETTTAQVETQDDSFFEPHGWRLSATELAATREKVAKLNERFARKGFTGRFDVVATEVSSTHVTETGFEITETWFETRIEGDAPSYGGFKFLAKVEWNEDKPIVQTAPFSDNEAPVDRSVLVPGHCAHCKINRYRKNTYIVRGEDGRDVQIGSTCIKDFLGWNATPVFISEKSVEDDVERSFGGSWGEDRSFSPDTILAVAWAAIRAHGFVRASDWNDLATGSLVRFALGASNLPKHRIERGGCYHCEIQAKIDALDSEGSKAEAAKIHEFILSDEFRGDSEYVQNLKSVASATSVQSKFINLLASAPQAFARHQEKTLIRERRESKPSSFVGQPKDKLTVEVEIVSVRPIEGDYGTTYLYTLREDATGNVFKWFASREALGDATGRTLQLQGTVKKHEEYNGLKSTVLTRCKEIEN